MGVAPNSHLHTGNSDGELRGCQTQTYRIKEMKIYLSTGRVEYLALQGFISILKSLGHVIISREDYDPATFVLEDLNNLRLSDAVMILSDSERQAYEHTCLGAALAYEKRCIWIGHSKIAFHKFPQVEHYKNCSAVLAALAAEAMADDVSLDMSRFPLNIHPKLTSESNGE